MQRSLFVAVLVVVVIGTVPAPTVAAEPTIDVAVDDTPMASGDRLVVPDDPLLSVNATARTTVERVVVRVDGSTVQTWVPGTETVSRSARLDLANEPQRVQVIVTGSDGSVAATQVTVEKDEVAPFVGFTDPFESSQFGHPPDELTVSQSRVTLAGELTDSAGVEFVRIRREHRVQETLDYEVVSETHVIRDPGERFSQELSLGPGENRVEVLVSDRFGNSRSYDLRFLIRDVTEPVLSLDGVPERTSSSTLLVNGTASDNVQVDSISYGVFDRVNRRSVVVGQGRGIDPDRRQLDFSRPVELSPGPNRITVWATDTSGNEVQQLVVVNYDRNVVPTVVVDEARTHLVAGESVHVYGGARDGRVTALSVETVDEGGSVVDFEQVYDGGDVWNDLSFDEELALAESGRTAVVVRAVDVDGTEHVTRHVIPAASNGGATPEPANVAVSEATGEPSADGGEPSETSSASEDAGESGTTQSSTAVEDGGFGAFAVAALLVVLVSFARLRNVTVEVPIEKYVDLDDTRPSLPSLPSLPRRRR